MVNPKPAVDIRAELAKTLFSSEGEDVLSDLCACARVEQFEVATLLNAANQPLEWLRLVVQGHIEIVVRRASGAEVAIADMGPGTWATWLACFVPPDHDFYSSASACYIALPTRVVREVCFAHPALYPRIIGAIGVRMRQLMEWTGQSVLMSPEQRMAKLIHLMARTQGIAGNAGTLHATQARLAQLARCSRQSANLLLGALENRGLIRQAYGRFESDDLVRLAVFSEEDASD